MRAPVPLPPRRASSRVDGDPRGPRSPDRARTGRGGRCSPRSLLLLVALVASGCDRGKPPATAGAPSPRLAAGASATASASGPAWLGRWVATEGRQEYRFELQADGTVEAYEFDGWERPKTERGTWVANPDGRTALMVVRVGDGTRPFRLTPAPTGLVADAGIAALLLTPSPGGRWPWEGVNFERRELLDGQVADLQSINALLYYTASGLDLLHGDRRLAGRPTEGLAEGTLLAPEPILKAMRARLDVLIREGGDPRWTEDARERLTGGRDRLGHPYEFYWKAEDGHVRAAVAPETRAAFRAVEERAWRSTYEARSLHSSSLTEDPWQGLVRPGSREVEPEPPSPPAKPLSAVPASPAAVPFGPGAAPVLPDRRAEQVRVVATSWRHARVNHLLPAGDSVALAARGAGWHP